MAVFTGTSAADRIVGSAVADQIHGLAGNDQLYGQAGDDLLDGGLGNDTLAGAAGNDTYVVDAIGDVVTEAAGEGIDTVQSAVTFSLGANVENLVLTGTAAINGFGNSLSNSLTGNAGANTLIGGAGDDVLSGGAGNDTYGVDSIGDRVIEAAGGGIDTVQSSVKFSLGANVENLLLTGSAAISGFGNSLDNTLTGNAGANILQGGAGDDHLIGGAGADHLQGGLGNDLYEVDTAGDVVTEALGEGIDTVRSSVSFSLGANVENLMLIGATDINGFGNSLNNTITGNAGANTLVGGLGDDVMSGGGGNDTYGIDSIGDRVIEAAGGGIDTVQSSVKFSLGANIENLLLTGSAAISGFGNSLNNTLTGNAGANILQGGLGDDHLIGGAGADHLQGGLGNDIYDVDNAGDVVTEAVDEGIDTVQSAIGYALGANVENLTLTGTTQINGTGNALNNSIFGNDGANTLEGKEGNDILSGGHGVDRLIGGIGNDTYYIDEFYPSSFSTDVVIEANDEGIDTVISSIGYTLGQNVENLIIGSDNDFISASGNSLNNVITGGGGENEIRAADGNDIIYGEGGNDSLYGGLGRDEVFGGDGSDLLYIEEGEIESGEIYDGGNGFDYLSTVGYSGFSDDIIDLTKVEIENIEIISLLCIDAILNASDLNGLYRLRADVVTIVGSGVVDLSTTELQRNFAVDLPHGLMSFRLSDQGNTILLSDKGNGFDVVGGAKADTVSGAGSADWFSGGDGNDILDGKGGADHLSGGHGADSLTGGAGADMFEYSSILDGGDTITDFSVAQGDKLVFQSLLHGTFSYLGASAFTSGGHTEARFADGQLFVDTDGNGTADITITLTGITDASQLHASDFVFS